MDDMPSEELQSRTSFAVKAGTVIVVLATIATLALTLSFLIEPSVFFRSSAYSHGSQLLETGFLGCVIVSGVGALCMLASTRNPWWIACLLVAATPVALFIFIINTIVPIPC